MAVDLTMTGSGTVGDIESGWSVTEYATPINLDDTAAGTTSVSLSAKTRPTSKFIVNNAATFTDSALGPISGTITDVTIGGVVTGFTINSLAALLSVERTAKPTGNQNLSSIMSDYVALVTDQIPVYYTASSDPLRVYPGWVGDVWQYLKQLCAANDVEIAFTDGMLIVRDTGNIVLSLDNSNNVSMNLSTAASGRYVDIVYQNPQLVSTINPTITNLSGNPSVETNSTGWAGSASIVSGGGSPSTATAARTAVIGPYGSYVMRLSHTSFTPSVANTVVDYSIYNEIDITSLSTGTAITGGMSFANPSPSALNSFLTAYGMRLSLVFMTPSNAIISTQYAQLSTGPGYKYVSGTVPAGASKVRLTFSARYQYPTSGMSYPGKIFDFDAAMLTVGPPVPYFTGTIIANNVAFYDAYKDNNNIMSVGVAETQVFTVETGNFPAEVAQPIQTTSFPGPVGTYYVSSAADNLPVTPAAWQAYGGSVNVAIGSVPGTIDITVKGPLTAIPGVNAPYQLAISDGDNTTAQLSIAGRGVITYPATLHLATGADPNTTTEETASTIDSPFIVDLAMAYSRGVWVAEQAAGPTVSLSATIATRQLAGFGLSAGALVTYNDSIYRIDTVSIGRTETNISATWYVRTSEFENLWASQNGTAFNAVWAGFEAQDLKIAPLRKA